MLRKCLDFRHGYRQVQPKRKKTHASQKKIYKR